MLCTFTKLNGGTLVIRSEDIKSIDDRESDGSQLVWLTGTEVCSQRIEGTARENMERLQREELETIARVESYQRETQARMQQGYPAIPVPRGKQR